MSVFFLCTCTRYVLIFKKMLTMFKNVKYLSKLFAGVRKCLLWTQRVLLFFFSIYKMITDVVFYIYYLETFLHNIYERFFFKWRHSLFSRSHSLGDSRRPSRWVNKRRRTGWSTRWRWRTPTTTRSTVTSLPPPQRQLLSEFSKIQSLTVRPHNHTSTSKIVVINSKKIVYFFRLFLVRYFVFLNCIIVF